MNIWYLQALHSGICMNYNSESWIEVLGVTKEHPPKTVT